VANLTGIYAALPTPLDSNRGIDEAGLEHLIEYLGERERLGGFALCTEAAEDLLLTVDERKTLVRLVSQMKSPEHGMIVRVSASRSKEASELAKVAESVGAQAVSLKLPRMAGVGYRELYRHVDHVCRAVKIPVLLHTVPGDGLESLQLEEFETLIQYKGLKGVIAPQASAAEIQRWTKWFGDEHTSILSGCSLARSATDAAGANGVVCGTYALIPEPADDLDRAISRGEKGPIKKIENKWTNARLLMGPRAQDESPAGLQKFAAKIAKRPLESKLVSASYSAPMIKAALKLQGHSIRAEVRLPLETLRKSKLSTFETQLRKVGILA
jgi:dihydrodipicolinate synthase/N-acetylneuraminate lyase